MTENAQNPLAEYMRQETVFMKLPSNGNFYNNRPNLTADGELGIRSMTSGDEIKLKVPDALFNGTAIVDVIKSCCPRISDPTEMPYNDVEAVLLAIRRATYGDDLAVSHKCKNAECGEEAQYAKSIDSLLANVPMLETQYVAEIKDGLKVFLKPISLFSSTELQIQAVEQQKLVERADAFDGSGEHVKAFQDSIIKIAMSNVKILTQCIYQIEMQDGKRVDQPEFISEWINNIDVAVFNQLMAKLLEIQDIVMKVEMDGECHKCKEPFNIPIIIDQSRFFGLA